MGAHHRAHQRHRPVLLEVREWPASGRLALPTPFPHITAAHLVNGRQRQPLRWLFNADATELHLELPVAPAVVPAASAAPALIELETAEKTAQFAGGRITFPRSTPKSSARRRSSNRIREIIASASGRRPRTR